MRHAPLEQLKPRSNSTPPTPAMLDAASKSDGVPETLTVTPPDEETGAVVTEYLLTSSPSASRAKSPEELQQQQQQPIHPKPDPLQAELPPMPKRPTVSPADLLAQSLSVLQEIKALVQPQQSTFMPDELAVGIFGECLGLAELLSKMGMKVTPIAAEPDVASRVRSAKLNAIFCECTPPAKVLPASFVTSVMGALPIPIILTTVLGKPWPQQVQSCIQAGATTAITLPTTPEVIRIVLSEALKSHFVSKSLKQNVSTHAILLSHLSKILMEQDHYLRSLGEHLALMEKYKKQSEKLIATLQSEVEDLHRVNKTHQQIGEKLKLENAAMKWKRAFDAASKLKVPGKGKALSAGARVIATASATAAEPAAEPPKKQAEGDRKTAPAETTEPAPRRLPATEPPSASTSPPLQGTKAGEDDLMMTQVGEDQYGGPLQMITRIVRRISKIDQYLDKTDLKNVLMAVVKALASKDWYTPSYKNLDDQTQLWVDSTFRNICPDAADGKTTGLVAESARSTAPATGRSFTTSTAEDIEGEDPAALIREITESVDRDSLTSWAFAATEYTHEQLLKFVVTMFSELNLLAEFRVPVHRMLHFLATLNSSYHANPYHNFSHACDVTQLCFMMLTRTKLPESLQRIDQLSLMIGALCHDLDHPGLNNVFQINAHTDLSILYNDVSVLENHHASFAWNVLRNDEDNIVANLTPVQLQELRKSIISEILATDMVKHFELVSRFKGHKDTSCAFSREKKEDRQLLLDTVLHAADISNLTRPQVVSRVWCDLLFDEYLRQGDEEKRAGLPVSPYMDRNDTDQVKMSINFIDFIGLPLFSAIAQEFTELSVCLENLRENRKWWEARRAAKGAIASQRGGTGTRTGTGTVTPVPGTPKASSKSSPSTTTTSSQQQSRGPSPLQQSTITTSK